MMATGSTEAAFASSSQALPCFNASLLKTDSKYWNGAQVLATTSAESFWEDDPEEKIKKRVLACKSQFHLGRCLQIKHLPRDVTEAEVRELLNDFPVSSISISNGPGSSMARAELEDPEMLEEWDRERTFLLRNQCVPVTPTATEMMLCVANMPPDYTEEQFLALVKSCGEVRRAFIMISEKTGDSKGYGFVEYKTNEVSLQAKMMLDKRHVNGHTLVCDWLDSSHVTFESLHSKCLYVYSLPKNFRDMSEFRKVFSSVVNPPYCQIALKNGCPQDWGLVEYSNWEDAEASHTNLNGYNLHGQNIRVSYYIPGVRAITLYLKLLNDPGPRGKSAGLLPEPTGQAIMQNLQNLFKQNPIFAQNLQTIIVSQIHAAQNGESPPETQKKGPPPPPPPIPMPESGRKPVYSPGVGTTPPIPSTPELSKSPTVPAPPPVKVIGLVSHQSPPGPPPVPPLPPAQFLKPTPPPPPPPTKVPLLPNPGMAPPSPRRPSLSPPTEDQAPPLPSALPTPPAPLEDEASQTYWAGVLGQLRGAPSTFPPPSPEAPAHPYHVPAVPHPANIPNMPVELHQSLMTLLSNPHNLQQLLHSLSQPAPSPSPVHHPAFHYPLPPGVEHHWAQPMPHLQRPLLTSPIHVAMSPMKPGPQMYPTWAPTFLPPSPQHVFSPFGSPGIIWPQASPAISPQPNPMMTPIGQKRRLLPSPEPSPEGNYIGQHSQGLGGHYADSYFKRKKKN